MRVIGKRMISLPGLRPSAAGLQAAAIHQATGQALAALAVTGIVKGIYRFKSHEEMNRFDDEALVRAIVMNMRARGGYV
jgi:hypothetical protein